MSVIDRPSVVESEQVYGRRWAALGVLCLSLLIVVMANTALIVAAPDMTYALKLTSQDLQWVIDAYTVPYAALMLIMGAIGDKYGRRAMLLAGLVLFASGGVLGGLVDSVSLVITARAVMGIAAAMIMPATLSLLVATFPRKERALAITIWTATSGLAIAFGPLMAGALLRDHGWASTFLINVPIAAVAILLAVAFVPPSKSHVFQRLDLLGGLLSVVGMAALIYTIIEGPRNGWHPQAIGAGIGAVVVLTAFVGWELRHTNPMLDIRKLNHRGVAGANLAVLLFFLATFGAIYYVAQHLQFVLGYDPLQTGIRLLPLAGAVFIGAAITSKMAPRCGLRATVVTGMGLGTLALALLVRVDSGSDYATFVAPLMLLGTAIGLSVAPCTDTIMGAFPERLLGVGGAMNDTSLEFGGSLGIAILGSLLSTSYRSQIEPVLEGSTLPPEAVDAAKDSVGGALAVAEQVAAAGAPQPAAGLVSAAHDAFAHAVSHTSLIATVILAVGTVCVGVVLPTHRRKPAHRKERPRGRKPAHHKTRSSQFERVAEPV